MPVHPRQAMHVQRAADHGRRSPGPAQAKLAGASAAPPSALHVRQAADAGRRPVAIPSPQAPRVTLQPAAAQPKTLNRVPPAPSSRHAVVQKAILVQHGTNDSQEERATLERIANELTELPRTGERLEWQKLTTLKPWNLPRIIMHKGKAQTASWEDVYIVGHGDGFNVGGMTPGTMAERLAKLLPEDYSGRIHLIACQSARLEHVSFNRRLAVELAMKGRWLPVSGIAGNGIFADGILASLTPQLSAVNEAASLKMEDLKKQHDALSAQIMQKVAALKAAGKDPDADMEVAALVQKAQVLTDAVVAEGKQVLKTVFEQGKIGSEAETWEEVETSGPETLREGFLLRDFSALLERKFSSEDEHGKALHDFMATNFPPR
jgi:hypothetical protein